MKGDSRWVTALHYAFQDDEYLVRRLGKVGGCCLGTKEMLGLRRERPLLWEPRGFHSPPAAGPGALA